MKNNKVCEKVRAQQDTGRSHKVIVASVTSLRIKSVLLPMYLKEGRKVRSVVHNIHGIYKRAHHLLLQNQAKQQSEHYEEK